MGYSRFPRSHPGQLWRQQADKKEWCKTLAANSQKMLAIWDTFLIETDGVNILQRSYEFADCYNMLHHKLEGLHAKVNNL